MIPDEYTLCGSKYLERNSERWKMQAGTILYLNDNVNAKVCLIKAEPRERSLSY